MKTFILLITTLLLGVTALAYIPSTNFIFTRLTAAHGRGTYIIDDEVLFQEGIETKIVKESWLIQDGGEMRVIANSDNLHVFRLLKRGRISWSDEGVDRNDEVGLGYYMRALITRSAVEEKKLFIPWDILPADVLKDKKLPKDLKDFKLESEPFVRLGRVGGTVAYNYGKLAPANSPLNPGLWIEQDAFNIRKMRTPDGTEIGLNDYLNYSKGLVFPKTQSVSFNNHTINIRVTRVSGITPGPEQKKQLEAGWIHSHPEGVTHWPKTSIGVVIQEFYKRFR